MSDSWEKIAIVILFALSPFILYGVYRLMQPAARPEPGAGAPDDEKMPEAQPEPAAPPRAAAKPRREKARVTRSGLDPARSEPSFQGGEAVAPQAQLAQTEHSFEPPPSPAGRAAAAATSAPPPPAPNGPGDPSEPDAVAAPAPRPVEVREEDVPPAAGAQAQAMSSDGDAGSTQDGEQPAATAAAKGGQGAADQATASDRFPELDDSKLQYNFFYTVRISLAQGVSTTAILDLKQTLTKAAPKMFQTTFCYDEQHRLWETPRPDRSYRFLAWSIPLCNRSVHLNKDNIASIVSVIQKAMRGINGHAEFPPHNDIERRLHLVEEFCDVVDQTVSVVLRASTASGGQPRSTNDILDLAQSWGMEEVGSQLCKIDNGETWYTLGAGNGKAFGSSSPERKVASLVVALDFPHVSRPLEAFDEMFEYCNKLAKVLNFQIVDTRGKPIEQDHVAALRTHMLGVRNHMIEHEVIPGSKTARALFN